MLVEIKSEIFNEEAIKFKDGLNVILGDHIGSNSIGKSTLLMIVDFIFGGSTYLSHNSDVVTEFGHHEYNFILMFESKRFYFSRSTSQSKIIKEYNENGALISSLSVKDYCVKLKNWYSLNDEFISFRSLVGLTSRVWGKQNLNVNRPLHIVPNEKNRSTVNKLIKYFSKYKSLNTMEADIKKLKEARSTFNQASKFELIPNVTKRKFQQNEKKIMNLEKEISSYKKQLEELAVKITDLQTDELLKLNKSKNKLLKFKTKETYRFNRIKDNISKNKTLNKKVFSELVDFFPNVNIEKLNNIDQFHTGITRIVKDEIEESATETQKRIELYQSEIDIINEQIKKLINNDNQSSYHLERLVHLEIEKNKLDIFNEYYNKKEDLKIDFEDATDEYKEKREKILKEIESILNDIFMSLSEKLYGVGRRAPRIELSDNNYEYLIDDNTGTGAAYTNLILFDIGLLKTVNSPFIIHDSVLFKQIENITLENIINYYLEFDRQIFISIDEILKYSQDTQEILINNKVIALDNNNLLFKKDWRSRSL